MKNFTCTLIRWIWNFGNVPVRIQFIYFVPSFNAKTEACKWYFPSVTTSIIISQNLISSTFVSDACGLMRCILYLIFPHHTVMWLYCWNNTVLSKMDPYMVFHILCSIIIKHEFISNFVVVVNSFINFSDIIFINWLVPAQDVHFFYTRSQLSALQKCALIFSTNF